MEDDEEEPEGQAATHEHHVKIHPILDGECSSVVIGDIGADFISRDTLQCARK